jgi:hypothetical protein
VAASEQLTERLVEVATSGKGGGVLGLADFEQNLDAAVSRNLDQLAAVGATIPLETARRWSTWSDLADAMALSRDPAVAADLGDPPLVEPGAEVAVHVHPGAVAVRDLAELPPPGP